MVTNSRVSNCYICLCCLSKGLDYLVESDMGIYSGINSCFLTALAVFLQIHDPLQGYYRCDWVPANDTNPALKSHDTDSTLSTTRRQCYYKDSDIMSSFVNHCTVERHFIRTCSDTGTWDCDAFVGFCKTLIKVQIPQNNDKEDNTSPTGTVPGASPNCAEHRAFFSLQEMGLAVLVSFISGSVILMAIMVLVWKCRHTGKLERQQSQTERLKEHRTAALEAITQIASALKPPQSSDAETVFYLNPAYTRNVASDIIDIISENDHIYEEVMLRRLSRSAQLTPASSRHRSSQMAKSSSLNSISEIAENLDRLERENLEILKKGMASVGEVIETVQEDERRYREGLEIEAPSTSDSGIIDDFNGNK